MEAGVCRLSIMPVRRDPSHQSEMVSQLLFGEHYLIVAFSENKEWAKIINFYDAYEGWIAVNQVNEISKEYYDQISHSDYKICLDVTNTILLGKVPSTICIGSIIPITSNELFNMEEKLAFTGDSKSLSQQREIEFILGIAHKYLNTPYLWGGRSPFGIDCSGFVQMVFKIGGYKIPRDCSMQITKGIDVKLEESKPGDLVFIHNKDGKMDHVGILLEDHKIIHASGKVRIDQLDEKGICHQSTRIYTHFNPIIRRIV